MDFNLCICMC